MFSFRACGCLLGIGAIKRLGPRHAEIKSMHTAEVARGRGIGRAMLTCLLGAAAPPGIPPGEPGDRHHSGIRPGPGAQASSRAARLPAAGRLRTTCS